MHYGKQWLALPVAEGSTKISSVLFIATWQTSVLICEFSFKLLREEAIKIWNISTFTWLVGSQSLFMSPCTFIYVRASACYIQLSSVLIFHFLWKCTAVGYNVMWCDFFSLSGLACERRTVSSRATDMREKQIETLGEQVWWTCAGQRNPPSHCTLNKEKEERKMKKHDDVLRRSNIRRSARMSHVRHVVVLALAFARNYQSIKSNAKSKVRATKCVIVCLENQSTLVRAFFFLISF